ncbi:hypothetical protein WICANDRAFT_36060 [Wickerhamomyces anomalus NRRL Y-366-8]|uniref:Uncharacterized protein n=1 Tax=Wickerhamomyces anomalus (strain ATCC 58044 / CBS 1984 / NCYC 433 / NRRL Y-366-8) TaxID=683960 RepID=A0A1E3NVL3_WICAA|nr:uncharacterized protein WICANDRAFT_36060 [Wickerhamomyces anomalus NRRL Y-366-8]ODQ57201.1 hypothetical protein WICANDRAFT_36060 [Wickerhamomyces anomalus NRRL Y-366-8]
MLRTIRARPLIRNQVSRFHSSALRLNDSKKKPEQIDEAEMFADRLNTQPYYAKRDPSEYPEGEAPLSQEQIKKQNQKLEAMKGLIQGVLVIGAMFGGFELYQKWPNVKSWWANLNKEDEGFVPPKKNKPVVELPVITNKNDSSVPGLYIWGDNSNGITGDKNSISTKWPLRHPWFDGKLLKKVTIGEHSALAIDPKGDLIQWGNGYKRNSDPEYTIKGEGLQFAKISNGAIYALNKNNEILVIPESSKDQQDFKGLQRRNWAFISSTKNFTKVPLDLLQKGETIKDFETGAEHLVALTDKGRAFSAATGFNQLPKSQGQYGLPEYSHFNKPPAPNTLHEITLLNNSIEKNKKGKVDHIEPRFIKKIAVGNYHTLALDENGEVFSFGQNTFGQLGQPVNYDTEFITIPKKVELLSKHVKRDLFPDVIDIHAGGDTSFCTINPVKMFRLIRGKNNKVEEDEDALIDAFTVGFGNNLKGQIGNGHYVHAQFDPVKIKELSKFEDYNEETGKIEKINIDSWSTGFDHTFIKLGNKDVLFWGGNDNGQLGNGKKNRIPKPTPLPAIVEPSFTTETYKNLTFVNRLQLRENQQIVASANASAIYYTK